ncbi:precorrin-3B C(17)-methyltransferase [Sphingomonas morindae]|uniref:Precorrin-3B C(17)-methyltransferase n=1 Tax=Sphingomonas morindae TaxID=1541170 RepID=A0ABY4X6J9_9SPHN|nr:precorrin-3B C(17)-methyltransferase [Sphingomonas morindae]USI72547.1 precorrin-3B C(17)-methyltransferase [Sphingomonas morindae]
MSGWLAVAGLGPGDAALITPEVRETLAEASDLLGYGPYVARVAARPGLAIHPSDNREELARARHGLALAAAGARAVLVCSGDPGVFAMAAAVCEAIETGPPEWAALDLRILPGITAMLAASARAGAPLGHDFCAINLSDNLKPWPLLARRLALAAEADFAIALYNPRSRARPDTLDRAFDLLRGAVGGARPVLFARALYSAEERLEIVALAEARGAMADMRTLVLIGSSRTRLVPRPRGALLYTPRSAA